MFTPFSTDSDTLIRIRVWPDSAIAWIPLPVPPVWDVTTFIFCQISHRPIHVTSASFFTMIYFGFYISEVMELTHINVGYPSCSCLLPFYFIKLPHLSVRCFSFILVPYPQLQFLLVRKAHWWIQINFNYIEYYLYSVTLLYVCNLMGWLGGGVWFYL